MKTDNIELTKEIVELKYKTLMQRIERIFNLFKTLSVIIDCDSEIKSIKMIQEQYKRMYNQLIKTGEYQKYEDIENAIIENLSKIEFKLDKKIHSTAKDYKNVFEGILRNIRESINYREFHNLYEEIEKIKLIKELAKQYIPFISENERNDINNKISKFKFELLIRRQVEQMVYENGGTSSCLKQFDSEEERTLFENFLEQLISKLEDDDEIKQTFNAKQIMENNILLNHVVFKVFEQKIEENAEQFIELLNVPIFNPHLCNIANNPYNRKIKYAKQEIGAYSYYGIPMQSNSSAKWLERDKINLSLLVAVLRGVINDRNTTIMECENIYNRFGFKCRPITINEGQELIRRIYDKVRPSKNDTKTKKSEKSNGQLCRLRFTPLNYDFEPIDEQFFTNAQILQGLQKEDAEKAAEFLEEIIKLQGKLNLSRREQEEMATRRACEVNCITKISNDWVRKPLEKMYGVLTHTPVPITYERRVVSSEHIFNRGTKYKYTTRRVMNLETLWRSYQSDLYGIDIDVKRIFDDICINLDDISDLPIYYGKAWIITEEQKKFVKRFGESQER